MKGTASSYLSKYTCKIPEILQLRSLNCYIVPKVKNKTVSFFVFVHRAFFSISKSTDIIKQSFRHIFLLLSSWNSFKTAFISFYLISVFILIFIFWASFWLFLLLQLYRPPAFLLNALCCIICMNCVNYNHH